MFYSVVILIIIIIILLLLHNTRHKNIIIGIVLIILICLLLDRPADYKIMAEESEMLDLLEEYHDAANSSVSMSHKSMRKSVVWFQKKYL